VDHVRASVVRATSVALDDLAAALPSPIASISLRAWLLDLPSDMALLRRAPYESQADSVMYRQVMAELAEARRWSVHLYNAATIEDEASRILRDRAQDVLHGPRRMLGPPWTKDHRLSLAATVVASEAAGR
jgi:hypothetical protein